MVFHLLICVFPGCPSTPYSSLVSCTAIYKIAGALNSMENITNSKPTHASWELMSRCCHSEYTIRGGAAAASQRSLPNLQRTAHQAIWTSRSVSASCKIDNAWSTACRICMLIAEMVPNPESLWHADAAAENFCDKLSHVAFPVQAG